MDNKLVLLVLIKNIWQYPKHHPKMEMVQSLEKYAEVHYWYEDGHIHDILQKLDIQPDFIFQYDIAWNNTLAPNIEGLGETEVATGCFVIDLHWNPKARVRYFENNKIDVIFSATKHPFLNVFPQYEEKLRWLPWSINPAVMKDYQLKKEIDSLLMGLVFIDPTNRGIHELPNQIPQKGRYAFRDTVFRKMKDRDDFVYHPHPGHLVKQRGNLLVNERYAKELNRSKIFFTCGSRNESGGIAVLKFFEAPACHTLLLAERNQDIEELGFVDGENYVACTVDNVVNKANYYLANEQERKRITKNGYEFVHQYHTNDQRAKQMVQEIKTFLLNK